MKRPSFQFYPGDWSTDLALRRCSPAARGVWMDVLCALHNSDDAYGLLRWPLKEIASTIGAAPAHMRELVEKGVLRGSDKTIETPLVYVPKSGRKEGAPVTLIPTQAGPLWYSKRLVKDEYIRTIRGESTRFGADDGEAPKVDQSASPKPPFGDGTSSASSSSPAGLLADADASAPAEASAAPKPPKSEIPDCPHQRVLDLWAEVLPAMPQHTEWNTARQAHLRARWREKAAEKSWASVDEGLTFFRKLFGYIGKSAFLTGKVKSREAGKPPFQIELEWLLLPSNWAKVIEGKYHQEV